MSQTPAARSAESLGHHRGSDLQPPNARRTFLSDVTDATATNADAAARPKSAVLNTSTSDSNENENDQDVFLYGIKLFSVVGSITLVIFIMLLDVSIISTVS